MQFTKDCEKNFFLKKKLNLTKFLADEEFGKILGAFLESFVNLAAQELQAAFGRSWQIRGW